MRRTQHGQVAWTILGVVALVAIALGVYFAVFATAGVRGRVALHNKVRSADSQAFNYDKFHNDCHSVIALTSQIATAEATLADLKANPPASDPFGQYPVQLSQARTDLQGMKNQRDSIAQAYNSASHEPLTHSFMKSHDLPTEIGPPSGVAYESLTCEGIQP